METLVLGLVLSDITTILLLIGCGFLLGETVGYHTGIEYKESLDETSKKVNLPNIPLDSMDT